MFWLNADKSTGAWKLHMDSCRFCKPVDTKVKGLNQMKNNGGWFKYDSYQIAFKFYQSEHMYSEYWQPCKVCNPK